MPKPKQIYVCSNCGAETGQWFGRCKECKQFNTISEEPITINPQSSGSLSRQSSGRQLAVRSSLTGGGRRDLPGKPRISVKFSDISNDHLARFSSGFGELDRVLGGGVVPGSLVLIGGDPGIGKSTLLLQVANCLSARLPRILYVTAEESGQQVKLRASRLNKEDEVSDSSDSIETDRHINTADNLYVMPETDLEEIMRELESLRPQVAVIDSIQTLHYAALTSAPGSVAQVRECTSALMQLGKRSNITLLIVGHVTKDGSIAGPRVLEHLVDTVLYFEGDRYAAHRLLRSVKNRFGATHEIGIFEMADKGLVEVNNPSKLFLGNQDELSPGTATVVACEGTRPILVELQALVSPTSYPSPRRSTTGVDHNRLQQILAVLEKRVGIPFSKLDAYMASAGGLSVTEPAADLGIAIALVASFRDQTVDARTVLVGEVGLGGQVRMASQMELRLKEAAKLGFKRAIVPKGQTLPADIPMEITYVSKVIEAIVAAMPPQTKTPQKKAKPKNSSGDRSK
ncbi:MAG: DNA repair protein RadA [Cyanobacteria bacterium J06642_3]